MKSTSLLLAVVVLGACIDAAQAEKYYKWTDSNGVVQYSSTPPPSQPVKEVTVSRAPTPAPAPAAPPPAATDDAAAEPNADVAARNAAAQQEYKTKMCAYARNQQAESSRFGTRRTIERRGDQRSVALPAQRAAEAEKWRGEIAKYCG